MNILMVSLGCDKNLCDSEAMLGLLAKHNYNITNDEQEADAIIVNTCSFIKDAMEESVNTVLEMAKLKQQNLNYLIVTGCMAQRFKDEIFDEIPEIDACLGTSSFDKILDVIEELKARNVGVSVHFIALHTMSAYAKRFGYKPEDFPKAYAFSESEISLPLYSTLGVKSAEYVADAVLDRMVPGVALVVKASHGMALEKVLEIFYAEQKDAEE